MKTLILLFSVLFTTMSFAQVPSYVPANGLVGWWPCNGNANDVSGNGNNGTVNGATLTTDRFGNANSAYGFDGLSNFIQTINSGPTGTGISVSYWYKSIQTNENIGVVVFGGNTWASYFEVTHNHWSSQQGLTGDCQFLVEKGADVHATNNKYDNQLHAYAYAYEYALMGFDLFATFLF